MTELDQRITDLFEHYYPALVRHLPMNDPHFIQKLARYKLINKEVIEALENSTEKSSYFLERAIKPELRDKLLKLLSVMKESSCHDVVDLAYKLQLHLILLQKSTGNIQELESKLLCSYT